MPELLFKSDLIEDLNFNYTSESVVRFHGPKNTLIFTAFDLDKATVIKLINKCIELSDDMFNISYTTYKDAPVLYISHGKLQTKPYWFNKIPYQSLQASSARSCYLPIVIETRFYDQLEIIGKKTGLNRGEVTTLAVLAEFSPNVFLDNGSRSIIKIASRLDTTKTYEEPKFELNLNPNGKGQEWLEEELAKIIEDESKYNNPNAVDEFSTKIKVSFANHKNQLKFDCKFDHLHYVIRAVGVAENVIVEDQVPIDFLPSKLEQLFAQNLSHFQGAYYLEIYDPLLDDTYIYFPALPIVANKTETQPCNLTVPNKLYYWMSKFVGDSNRFRISMLNQAFENLLPKWVEECENHDSKSLRIVKDKMQLFRGKSRSLKAKVEKKPTSSKKKSK